LSNPGKDQIRGWKEIGAYFARDERTVKRWEKQRALPVRRIPGEGRANVYILVSEAEAWLAGNQAADPPAADGDSQGAAQAGASLPAAALKPGSVSAANPMSESATTGSATQPKSSSGAGPQAVVDDNGESGAPVVHARRRVAAKQAQARMVMVALLGAAGLAVVAGVVYEGHRSTQGGAGTLPHVLYRSPKAGADALYLQGVYFNEKRTPDDLERALQSFRQAIVMDPGHAPAYAGLSQTYLLLREYGTMPEADAYARAEAAARRALALDPNMPEAHASLGFIAFFFGWNAQQATNEFATALRLDPNCTIAHHWYGSMLTHQGRYTEALQQLDAAQQLEPASAAILASKAYALGLSGRRDEAMDMLQPLVKTDQAVASPHRILATLSLLPPRDIPRFLKEMRRFAEIRKSQDSVDMMSYGADAFQRGGERQMWAEMLAKEKERHRAGGKPTYLMAEAQAALGLENDAIQTLSILKTEHDPSVIGMGIDPLFHPLRDNPQFREMTASIGLGPQA
jgi:cytochrome c-type biogenesis protein CcmH/NrfG